MRENIGLYKAKRKDNGDWVEGSFVTLNCINPRIIINKKYIKGLSVIDSFEIDPETLCECTGLKDKNGKLIFEGDIVKYKNNYYNDLTAIVEQKEARYGIWDKTPENKVNDKYCFIFNCICMYLGQYEVIGNKFDNKELLGE